MRLALAFPIVLGAAMPMRGLSVDAVRRRGVRMLQLAPDQPTVKPIPPADPPAEPPPAIASPEIAAPAPAETAVEAG